MKVIVTAKELLNILNEKFESNVEIDEIQLMLPVSKYTDGFVVLTEDNWYISEDIRKKLKEEEKRN